MKVIKLFSQDQTKSFAYELPQVNFIKPQRKKMPAGIVSHDNVNPENTIRPSRFPQILPCQYRLTSNTHQKDPHFSSST